MTRKRKFAPIVVLLLGACAERVGPDGGWSGAMRDSAGVTIVENPAAGIWTDDTRWTVHRDLTIGTQDGPEEYQFGFVKDVDAGPDGRIYVLDQVFRKVRVYEADGRHAFTFGRVGEGPGEFSTVPSELDLTTDGMIAIADPFRQAIHLFREDGSYARHLPYPPGNPNRRALGSLPGSHWLRHSVVAGREFLMVDRQDGTAPDTILAWDGPTWDRETFRSAWLLPTGLWGITSGNEIVFGITSSYRIEVRAPDRTLRMIVLKDEEPQALDQATREAFASRWEQRMQPGTRMFVPGQAPVFSEIAGGPEGTIWVRRILPADSFTLEYRSGDWDVFAHDGRFLGSVTLPPNFEMIRMRGSHIYGTATSEVDVQRVERLTIQRP